MLVLKNGGNVIAEAGKPLVNNEVNALRIENTDRITIGFVTTGPIAISWGDGTVLNLSTKATRYNASKLYSAVGNWNIVVTGVDNVKEIYFDINIGYGGVNKINTSVLWFAQLIKVQTLYLNCATFNGELSYIVDTVSFLSSITLVYNITSNITFNVDLCQRFWARCKYIYVYSVLPSNILKGSFSNVNINTDCEYVFFDQQNITGNVDGILKNGYTKLTEFKIGCASGKLLGFSKNIDDITIPSTLTSFSFNNGNLGILKNFNFKNLIWYISQCSYSQIDLTANQSFETFASKCQSFYISFAGSSPIKVPINKFTSTSLKSISLMVNEGCNSSYGDITAMSRNFITGNSSLIIQGIKTSSDVTGTIDVPNYKARYLLLGSCDVSLTAQQIKELALKCSMQLYNMSNVTGDISGINFTSNNPAYYNAFTLLPNLYGDITSFTFGGAYLTQYSFGYCFKNCPHFTGNLANLALWANKSIIDLSACAYTGIPGFVRKIFTNRNTCLKAAGGMTAISVQGNVDNNLLTGIEQQPTLGSYTGNINDLTEAQIDNLAAGKDYTGTGTSTPWTDKEKIWVMTKLKNSSTDSSLRYRCTFSY